MKFVLMKMLWRVVVAVEWSVDRVVGSPRGSRSEVTATRGSSSRGSNRRRERTTPARS